MFDKLLRKVFNIGHPWRCFVAGLVLCGLSFPKNWITRENASRQEAMEKTHFGITAVDTPEMADAWDRIHKSTRMSHDLKNLAIEWTRRWNPYSTKFYSLLLVTVFIIELIRLGFNIANLFS